MVDCFVVVVGVLVENLDVSVVLVVVATACGVVVLGVIGFVDVGCTEVVASEVFLGVIAVALEGQVVTRAVVTVDVAVVTGVSGVVVVVLGTEDIVDVGALLVFVGIVVPL